ncbi:HalOD1 output domain-containing protein [Halobellus litoreus]|uniref:HalOD1 output domain-containing protein n=1 Tax=Halobellus litoreus TaxID=755310 RepID=A0ABD6DW83_9EURY|nr:HalOD1 output domain-containing protein [Halobellus litoreus]
MSDERTKDPTDSNPDHETVRARYDWESTPPSTAIVETIAEATGDNPTALEPLYESVDPDALNALLTSVPSRTAGRDLRISLSVDGHAITVFGDGGIVVRPDGMA